jgi:hypothetical protein
MMTTLAERFWSKVGQPDANGCWPWLAASDKDGYGFMWGDERHRKVRAHRVVYELLVGPLTVGLQIDHLCRNRRCVNPAHLELVTARENTLRGDGPTARLAKRLVCSGCGRPYDEMRTDGSRRCSACNRRYQREWRRKRDGHQPRYPDGRGHRRLEQPDLFDAPARPVADTRPL